MSDVEDTNSQPAQPQKKVGKEKFSPFAGCLILIIAGLLIGGVIGYSTWSYFKVKETIVSFTDETPQNIKLVSLETREKERTNLTKKLTAFKKQIDTRKQDSITLNVDELNLAIASYEILKPNREKIYLTEITQDGIQATIAYPVKAGLKTGALRSINAEINIVPELVDGALFPTVTAVTTSKTNDIPQEFKKFISESMLHPLRNDEKLGDLFQRFSKVELTDGALLIETDPSYDSEAVLPDDTRPIVNRFMKGFAIVAVIFLCIVTAVIFLSRRQAQQQS